MNVEFPIAVLLASGSGMILGMLLTRGYYGVRNSRQEAKLLTRQASEDEVQKLTRALDETRMTLFRYIDTFGEIPDEDVENWNDEDEATL